MRKRLLYLLLASLWSAAGLHAQIEYRTDSIVRVVLGNKTSKTVYAYDVRGNQILRAEYRWDSSLNDWFEYAKNESVFDADGNQTLTADYTWDYFSNDWVGTKSEYSYDANGYGTLRTRFFWR
jgi:hypothetical protein